MNGVRVRREIARLATHPPPGISAAPVSESDIYNLSATIVGPSQSVYEGGIFHFNVTIPTDYPFSPPRVMAKTKIYHPNISNEENYKGGYYICVDMLQKDAGWSPALTLEKVMLGISSLLMDPNCEHGMNQDALKQYIRNQPLFDKTARDHTKRYASG